MNLQQRWRARIRCKEDWESRHWCHSIQNLGQKSTVGPFLSSRIFLYCGGPSMVTPSSCCRHYCRNAMVTQTLSQEQQTFKNVAIALRAWKDNCELYSITPFFVCIAASQCMHSAWLKGAWELRGRRQNKIVCAAYWQIKEWLAHFLRTTRIPQRKNYYIGAWERVMA